MAFYVGQKVVCVRDEWTIMPINYNAPTLLPKAGAEYIIREITSAEPYDGPAFRFHWMIYPPTSIGVEPAFALIGVDGEPNFRVVDEQKTDISIFTAMLNTKQHELVE